MVEMNSTKISKDAAHKKKGQIFEVVFGVPFIVGVALKWIMPVAFPYMLITPANLPVSIALIIAGLILVILSRQQLAQYNQPTDPGHSTTQLVTSGVFSISRNPLYLGGICILLGVAFFFELIWAIIFLLPSFIAAHYILILPEERYLASKFGEDYATYVASVKRWIGHSKHKYTR